MAMQRRKRKVARAAGAIRGAYSGFRGGARANTVVSKADYSGMESDVFTQDDRNLGSDDVMNLNWR